MSDLDNALRIMLVEVSDAMDVCKRMSAKQTDETMALYHDGQADAYRMVKRGIEKKLMGSARTAEPDIIQECQNNAIKIMNMANDIGCYSYNEQDKLTELAREIFNLLEVVKSTP